MSWGPPTASVAPMNRVLPAVALGGIQWRFQARILVRKEVKGATVLMCTHVATG